MSTISGSARALKQYHVYVIELSPQTKDDNRFCVYVGQSWHEPERRFLQHKEGIRAARVVRRSGLRLRPDLVAGWGPYASREDSLAAEAELAAELRERGYRVFGGH